jgi:hypothetical protein
MDACLPVSLRVMLNAALDYLVHLDRQHHRRYLVSAEFLSGTNIAPGSQYADWYIFLDDVFAAFSITLKLTGKQAFCTHEVPAVMLAVQVYEVVENSPKSIKAAAET